MDQNAPAPKPDMMEQMKKLLERYSMADPLAKRFADSERDSTLVIASAVLAVCDELRDIHNVLHEINGHMGKMAGILYRAEYDDRANSEVYE